MPIARVKQLAESFSRINAYNTNDIMIKPFPSLPPALPPSLPLSSVQYLPNWCMSRHPVGCQVDPLLVCLWCGSVTSSIETIGV